MNAIEGADRELTSAVSANDPNRKQNATAGFIPVALKGKRIKAILLNRYPEKMISEKINTVTAEIIAAIFSLFCRRKK